jgi:hypothetical protein
MTGGHQSRGENGNWLNGEAIACRSCNLPLFRVDHSPFYDSWFFYCDRCPKRVDLSYHDPEVTAIYDNLVARGHNAFQSDRMFAEIERQLAPCECGGQFRLSAERRCHRCNAVVLVGGDAYGVDVWPLSSLDEPTPEREQEWQDFEFAYIKHNNLWRHKV